MFSPQFRSYGNYGLEFHEGLLTLDNGRYSRLSGSTLVNPNLESSQDFSEGLAVAMPKQSKTWGFIDHSGTFLISPQFESAFAFSDGAALVRSNGKHGYIDHSGKYVIEHKYPLANSFHEGVALVIDDGPCDCRQVRLCRRF